MLSKQKQDRLRRVKTVKNQRATASAPSATDTVEPDHAVGTRGDAAPSGGAIECPVEPAGPNAAEPGVIYFDFDPSMPLETESTGPGSLTIRRKLNIPPDTPVGQYQLRMNPDSLRVDPDTYTVSFKHGLLTIRQATPKIMWSAPSAICQGTPLGDEQLNAATDVPGSFSYTQPHGDVLLAGTQILSAKFTPTDCQKHKDAIATVSLTVNPVTL